MAATASQWDTSKLCVDVRQTLWLIEWKILCIFLENCQSGCPDVSNIFKTPDIYSYESNIHNYDADLQINEAVSWSVFFRYLIRVLSRRFHRRPIQHSRWHKLKRGLIRPNGQTDLCYPLCGSGNMVSRIILKLYVAKDTISCILGAKFDRKWVVCDHMHTELHEATSAVLSFKYHFLLQTSQSVSFNTYLHVCKF